MHACGFDPALEVGAKRRGLGVGAACGDMHLLRVTQVKGQVSGRGVAFGCLGLQAAQRHLLQPFGQIGAVLAGRNGVDPQALAQARWRVGRAKRQSTGAHLVQHHANGKNVAARVTAHPHHLFGRNPTRRTHGFAQLLGQQVGVVRVVGQAKVEQDRITKAGLRVRAFWFRHIAKQHIGRFEVQVHRVLLVQRMRRMGHGTGQAHDHRRRQRTGQVQPVLQGAAAHVFHDQVGHALQVARSHKPRHVAAGEHLQDVAFHLEADDVFCPIAAGHAGHFHGQRKAGVVPALGVGHPVNMGHATAVHAFVDGEAVQHGAVFQQLHRPISRRCAKNSGKPAWRMDWAAA